MEREKTTGDFKEGEAVGLRGGGRMAVRIMEKIGERGRGKRIEKLGFLNYYFIGCNFDYLRTVPKKYSK